MLRLLPLPIFICIYLFSWWRCKKNIIASDKQLKPCIDWAYIKNLPLPPKPSFVEFYIVYVSSFFKFPFGIIIQQLPFAKKVRYYEREMKLIFDKWNLEKIKKLLTKYLSNQKRPSRLISRYFKQYQCCFFSCLKRLIMTFNQ
ncbi:MAG: hypothetical protein CM15mP96_3380 [Gammaproteobacteria bacterium]|nr:MAG: hypothetical protein CM15mP96_3380 [Gammaproteobacteria bacterium]